jgi:hypothetical protein
MPCSNRMMKMSQCNNAMNRSHRRIGLGCFLNTGVQYRKGERAAGRRRNALSASLNVAADVVLGVRAARRPKTHEPCHPERAGIPVKLYLAVRPFWWRPEM